MQNKSKRASLYRRILNFLSFHPIVKASAIELAQWEAERKIKAFVKSHSQGFDAPDPLSNAALAKRAVRNRQGEKYVTIHNQLKGDA